MFSDPLTALVFSDSIRHDDILYQLIYEQTSKPTNHRFWQLQRSCLKRPLKNRQIEDLMANGSLMKVESIAERSFDRHEAIFGIENHFCLFESNIFRQVLPYLKYLNKLMLAKLLANVER